MRKQRNRCFPDKAVTIWHQLYDRGHVRLVEEYLREAGNFENVRGLDRSPSSRRSRRGGGRGWRGAAAAAGRTARWRPPTSRTYAAWTAARALPNPGVEGIGESTGTA